VSVIALVLLLAALAVVIGAEWPRLAARAGIDVSARRARRKRKSHLRVVEEETDDFARSVERDLAALPTVDERD
jgi:hypothetical protein